MQDQNSSVSAANPTVDLLAPYYKTRTPPANRIDMVGREYGWLTVIRYEPSSDSRVRQWLCKCRCGNEKVVAGHLLRSGKTKSCGCVRRFNDGDPAHVTAQRDLTGQTFNKLFVIGFSHRDKTNGRYWKCRCECGNEILATTGHLTKGSRKSCGCLREQFLKKLPRGRAGEISLYKMYVDSAGRRGYSFELTEEECCALFRSPCHYCGIKATNRILRPSGNGEFWYNGIDRLDNARGYSLANSVPCCSICNKAKFKMGYQEFLEWVAMVYKHIVAPKRSNGLIPSPINSVLF